jgi:hypothetical protein
VGSARPLPQGPPARSHASSCGRAPSETSLVRRRGRTRSNFDLVETNSERNGGFCNVHYGTTNTQTGPHNFAGDLTQWHIYGCELNSDGMVFCLDGNVIKKLTDDHVRSMYMPHSRSSYRPRNRRSKRLTRSKLWMTRSRHVVSAAGCRRPAMLYPRQFPDG